MCWRSIVLSFMLIEVATKCFVEGLQCYVCEDCNEYEDFKELHICGEIPIEITIRPITVPEVTAGSASIKTTTKPTVESSSKPTAKPAVDDYLYEDNAEAHDLENLEPKKTTKAATMRPMTELTNTKPASMATETFTKTSASLNKKPTEEQKTTTERSTTNKQQVIIHESNAEDKKITSNASATKPGPLIVPDYDDYLEYEDPIKVNGRGAKSLLKINEPVCYMIKYHVNNTVLSNRGCIASNNNNKYLTCQSLYNGHPMESCRICSSNGCNKFLDDDGDEDHHGIFYNAAGVPKQIGVFIASLWALLNCSII